MSLSDATGVTPDPPPEAAEPRKLGAFLGVFTPTVLTILGVILFLRMGWVVGNAGLFGAFVIVLLANSITLLTALSMSSLATNMRVGVGGAYYLISRTLGLEMGGAIGIPLYLSQTLSVTLYAYGLAESVRIVWPGAPVQILAVLVIAAVTFGASRSAELALKAQLPIMAFIALAIGSLYLGVDWGSPRAELIGGWEDASFMQVFAVFFPAVTGVLAGVSLSGDLEDPGQAIPVGTLAAVAVGFVVYLITPLALFYAATPDELRTNSLLWTEVAWVGWLVLPGLWGAILSSAVGSVLGAPRTLQALAYDGLAPAALGRNDEATGEPVTGLWLSGGLALAAALVLPGLNAVAEWVTVFFLTTYGALNTVAAVEALVGDPSFRPRIRVSWGLSAAGALGCIAVMALINPIACLVALVIEGLLFWTISRRQLKTTWGDVRTGIWLSGARWALMNLREARHDPRNWRPHLLVFTRSLADSLGMVQVASRFGQHRGIVTIVQLLIGDLDEADPRAVARANQEAVERTGLVAFCEAVAVPDLDEGVLTVAQSNGFAGLNSNTVLFGWPSERDERGRPSPERLGVLLSLVRKLGFLDKSTLLHRPAPEGSPPSTGPIVVWWKGREHNGDLMLLLAHLLRSATSTDLRPILLKSIVPDAAAADVRRAEFTHLLPDIRIDAEVDVIVNQAGEDVAELLARHSAGASLVFLGMSAPGAGEEAAYAERLITLVEGLPETLLVRNAGPFRGKLV